MTRTFDNIKWEIEKNNKEIEHLDYAIKMLRRERKCAVMDSIQLQDELQDLIDED